MSWHSTSSKGTDSVLLILCTSVRRGDKRLSRREMTAVFPLTWQTFRLGLHASSTGRASVAKLRDTLSHSSPSKQHFRSVHGFVKRPPILSPRTWNARRTDPFHAHSSQLIGQARCASLWKSSPEEPTRRKAAQTKTPKSRAEINAIFGLKVGQKDGNDLLHHLQEQRHQGTLDQKLPYPDALIDKGLTYLRAQYPLDEDAAIIARIDREAEGEYRLPQTEIDRSPQAVSQFEKLIRDRRERAGQEKAKPESKTQKVLTERSPKEGSKVTARDGTSLVKLRPEPEWVQRYREKAEMTELPEMSTLARLVPSGLVTIAVVIVAALFAQNYKQPSRNARLWPDLPPAAATVIALLSVNVAVFILWRLPPFWQFLNRNFLVVPAYPHSVSMLTACFSHQSFTHLLSNSITMWLIGTRRTFTQVLALQYATSNRAK